MSFLVVLVEKKDGPGFPGGFIIFQGNPSICPKRTPVPLRRFGALRPGLRHPGRGFGGAPHDGMVRPLEPQLDQRAAPAPRHVFCFSFFRGRGPARKFRPLSNPRKTERWPVEQLFGTGLQGAPFAFFDMERLNWSQKTVPTVLEE